MPSTEAIHLQNWPWEWVSWYAKRWGTRKQCDWMSLGDIGWSKPLISLSGLGGSHDCNNTNNQTASIKSKQRHSSVIRMLRRGLAAVKAWPENGCTVRVRRTQETSGPDAAKRRWKASWHSKWTRPALAEWTEGQGGSGMPVECRWNAGGNITPPNIAEGVEGQVPAVWSPSCPAANSKNWPAVTHRVPFGSLVTWVCLKHLPGKVKEHIKKHDSSTRSFLSAPSTRYKIRSAWYSAPPTHYDFQNHQVNSFLNRQWFAKDLPSAASIAIYACHGLAAWQASGRCTPRSGAAGPGRHWW